MHYTHSTPSQFTQRRTHKEAPNHPTLYISQVEPTIVVSLVLGYLVCMEKCLGGPVNDTVMLLRMEVSDEDDDWSVRLSYACLETGHEMVGGPDVTCCCGKWSGPAPYCICEHLLAYLQ